MSTLLSRVVILWLVLGGDTRSWGAPLRVSEVRKEQSQVDRIFLAPGMVTVLEFPEAIKEARVGLPQSFKVQISSVTPSEMTISRAGSIERPSNLIVRTGRRIWVFDLIPSRASHQDFIRVRTKGVSIPTHQAKSEGRVIEKVKFGGGE